MRTLIQIIRRYPLLAAAAAALTLSQVPAWFNLYHEVSPYDKLVHFVFSAVGAQLVYVTLAGYGLLGHRGTELARLPLVQIMLMVLLVGTTIGVWWEFVEFSSDRLLGTHAQKGNFDTMTDLLADTAGAVTGGVFLSYRSRRYPPH